MYLVSEIFLFWDKIKLLCVGSDIYETEHDVFVCSVIYETEHAGSMCSNSYETEHDGFVWSIVCVGTSVA